MNRKQADRAHLLVARAHHLLLYLVPSEGMPEAHQKQLKQSQEKLIRDMVEYRALYAWGKLK